MALNAAGDRFVGIRIEENHETENLGARVAEPAFTDQFRSLPAPAYLDGYTGLERTAESDDRWRPSPRRPFPPRRWSGRPTPPITFIRDTQGWGREDTRESRGGMTAALAWLFLISAAAAATLPAALLTIAAVCLTLAVT